MDISGLVIVISNVLFFFIIKLKLKLILLNYLRTERCGIFEVNISSIFFFSLSLLCTSFYRIFFLEYLSTDSQFGLSFNRKWRSWQFYAKIFLIILRFWWMNWSMSFLDATVRLLYVIQYSKEKCWSCFEMFFLSTSGNFNFQTKWTGPPKKLQRRMLTLSLKTNILFSKFRTAVELLGSFKISLVQLLVKTSFLSMD